MSKILNIARRASTVARFANKGATYNFLTNENNKKPNQDVVGIGQFTNESFSTNPREFLRKLSADMARKLAGDERLNSSGSTCNVSVVADGKLRILSLGDSPTYVSIRDENGNRMSIKLTQDHKFSDREFSNKFKTEKDARGVVRYKGLSVPCLGHNHDEEIAKTEPRILEYDFRHLPGMASMMGIGSKISAIDLFVASDGLCEMNLDESSIDSVEITTSQLALMENDKMRFLKSSARQDGLSKVIALSENPAESLMENALANNSQDNISVAHVSFSSEYLQNLISGKNQSSPIAIFVFDGNGQNGHIAAEKLSEIVRENMQLAPIEGLPLRLPNPSLSPDALALEPLRGVIDRQRR